MAVTTMSLDEYLNRPGQGGGTPFLKGWRKREEVVVWLHAKAKFVSVYQHNFPRIVEREYDGKKRREIWGGSIVSLEPQSVLRAQKKRNDDGTRKVPATVDPLSFLIDELCRMIQAEELSWTDRLFVFEGDEDKRIVYAGGFVGMFSGELDNEQKEELFKNTGLRQKEAWNQSGLAKQNWVFSVVDNSDVVRGVQIAVETGLLGDKMADMIEKEMERSGPQGNPLRHPYAIKWKYREREREFHKKYDAVPQPMIPLTDEVKQLITETDAPDVSRVTSLPNYRELRARMEQYCVVDLDWDKVFRGVWRNLDQEGRFITGESKTTTSSTAKAAPAAEPEPKSIADHVEAATAEAAAKAKAAPAVKASGRRKKEVAPPPPPPPTGDPCDECGAPMASTDAKCGKCGAEYDVDPPADTAKPFSSDDEDDPFAEEP